MHRIAISRRYLSLNFSFYSIRLTSTGLRIISWKGTYTASGVAVCFSYSPTGYYTFGGILTTNIALAIITAHLARGREGGQEHITSRSVDFLE